MNTKLDPESPSVGEHRAPRMKLKSRLQINTVPKADPESSIAMPECLIGVRVNHLLAQDEQKRRLHVAELSRKIANGEYRVDRHEVVHALIEFALENDS